MRVVGDIPVPLGHHHVLQACKAASSGFLRHKARHPSVHARHTRLWLAGGTASTRPHCTKTHTYHFGGEKESKTPAHTVQDSSCVIGIIHIVYRPITQLQSSILPKNKKKNQCDHTLAFIIINRTMCRKRVAAILLFLE